MNILGLFGLCLMLTMSPAIAAPPAVKTADFATSAVIACQELAASSRLRPLSIAVIDTSGTRILFARQPGASIATADTALLKAKSAWRMGVPTALLANVPANGASTLQLLGIAAISGGAPLKLADGTLVGSIGVSGAKVTDDDGRCAAAAAAVVH